MAITKEETLRAMVAAELEARSRRERLGLQSLYDWYAPSCPCGIDPDGPVPCKIHKRARRKQRPPNDPLSMFDHKDKHWRIWFLMAGRGGGKTEAGSRYVNDQVANHGVREVVILNATTGDTRDVNVLGISGLVETSPSWCKACFLPSRSQVEWRTNGGNDPYEFIARGYLRTSEVPDGLRGLNASLVWGDEPGKWVKQADTWRQIGFVLRNKIDPPPRCVLTGTPTPTDLMYELQKRANKEKAHPGSTRVFIMSWHTQENAANLAESYIAEQVETYGNSLIGQQELGGMLVLRKAGSLWEPEDMDREGFRVAVPDRDEMDYIAVAVDPAMGGEDEERASETGIIIGGRIPQMRNSLVSRGIVMADRSASGQPGDWAKAVVHAYFDFQANEIIAEKNQGGEMVRHTIQSVPAEGRYPSGKNVPIRLVYASVGKMARAEPIQALYQAGRIQHVMQGLELLERQMLQFLPANRTQKLDRVDALVWLMTGAILEFDDRGDAGPTCIGLERDPFRYEGEPTSWMGEI